MSFTSDNNVQQFKDPTGQITALSYDANNNHTSTQLPTGATLTFQCTDSSHPYYPTSATDPQGNTTSYSYDSHGNVLTITDALASQNRFTFTYNANGTLASSTNALGGVTTYGYDNKGNLTSITPPSPLGAIALGYDSLSRLTSYTDGNGNHTSFAYDALDRVTQVTYADSTSNVYSFDFDGNLTSLSDNTGTTTFTYDPLNRLLTKTLPNGNTITYSWDGVGNLLSLADAGGTVTYAYNAVNLLTTLTEPGGAQTTFAYDSSYHRTQTVYPNGVTMTAAYDSSDRLTSISSKNAGNTTLTSFTYSYTNPATGKDTSLRYSVTDAAGNATAYAYDPLNRLLEAKTTHGGTTSADYQYTFDGDGNRLSQTVNGRRSTFSYNSADEDNSVGYDNNGNVTLASSGNIFGYNNRNQTSQITQSAILTNTFSGDGQAQLVGTSYVGGPITTTSYQYGLLGVQLSSTGGANTALTRDPAGTLVGERTPTAKYYYLFDGLGSVVGMTDQTGALANTYQYDPYGVVVASTGTAPNPWLFCGQFYDGTFQLYKIGIRYYDSATGRFTQRDPLPHLADPAQRNPYAYAGDDPVNLTDPSGADCSTLAAEASFEAVVALGIAAIIALDIAEANPTPQNKAAAAAALIAYDAAIKIFFVALGECLKPGSPPPQLPSGLPQVPNSV